MENQKKISNAARVIAVHKERYQLQIIESGEECFGRLKASVYYHGAGMAYPVTGDIVSILPNEMGDVIIIQTHPRRTFFQRFDGFSKGNNQAIAANFDTVFILTSANHEFNPKRIRRYLAVARQSGANYAVLLTKADKAENISAYQRAAEEEAPHCPVFAISVITGYGLEAVKGYLKPGTITVFLGSSGVGKSTLVNALAGKKIMDVNGIREDDSKGRHTTTHRQIIALDSGAMIMDTPGMRELGLIDAAHGVNETFANLEFLPKQCRFSNCSHTHEPQCAVRAAIERGEITQAQWDEFQGLSQEAHRKSKEEWIAISKRQKALSKQDRHSSKGWDE